ncbi:MAG: hypothetical protein ACOX6V_01220 [Patescibacteria group bacterium]|jgi:hypothetical protein
MAAEILSPGINPETVDDLDLTIKENWSISNQDKIAQRYGFDPQDPHFQACFHKVSVLANSAKIINFLPVIFEGMLKASTFNSEPELS